MRSIPPNTDTSEESANLLSRIFKRNDSYNKHPAAGEIKGKSHASYQRKDV
jgi:hypothetical protein